MDTEEIKDILSRTQTVEYPRPNVEQGQGLDLVDALCQERCTFLGAQATERRSEGTDTVPLAESTQRMNWLLEDLYLTLNNPRGIHG